MRRSLLIVAFLLVTLGLTARTASPVRADIPDAEISGTVTSFDPDTSLLTLNTRLGARVFLVTGTTVYLLNNHSATVQSITVNDRVSVTYDYVTSTATVVHLYREARQSVRVVGVSTTAISVRLNGSVLALVLNAAGRVELEGISLTDRSVLVNRGATVVYEPGTLILLSLSGKASVLSGRLSAIDVTNSKVTVSGRKKRVLSVTAKTTLQRGGHTATLTAFKTGDRVRLAYAGSGATLRVLALQTVR